MRTEPYGPRRTPDVALVNPAIWARRGPAPQMAMPHRHDDLEVNYVVSGQLEYLFGGTPLRISAGQIAIFWAAIPHRLIPGDAAEDSDNCWVHVPLTTVFSWALPSSQLNALLTGRPIIVPAEAGGRHVEPMFASWLEELHDGATEAYALLEIQALVGRLLHHHFERRTGSEPDESEAGARSDGLRHVAQMAQFAVGNFRTAITPADIARSAHLNPNYAMTLFRETMGTTLGGYLVRCRVTEAQRLLLTTDLTTTDVAHAAGFGSQSTFYSHFTKVCGVSPNQYRRHRRVGR